MFKTIFNIISIYYNLSQTHSKLFQTFCSTECLIFFILHQYCEKNTWKKIIQGISPLERIFLLLLKIISITFSLKNPMFPILKNKKCLCK